MVSIKEILKNTVFLYIILSALFFFFAIVDEKNVLRSDMRDLDENLSFGWKTLGALVAENPMHIMSALPALCILMIFSAVNITILFPMSVVMDVTLELFHRN